MGPQWQHIFNPMRAAQGLLASQYGSRIMPSGQYIPNQTPVPAVHSAPTFMPAVVPAERQTSVPAVSLALTFMPGATSVDGTQILAASQAPSYTPGATPANILQAPVTTQVSTPAPPIMQAAVMRTPGLLSPPQSDGDIRAQGVQSLAAYYAMPIQPPVGFNTNPVVPSNSAVTRSMMAKALRRQLRG
jgi:hypothetical protein